jgi:hypothetical protein
MEAAGTIVGVVALGITLCDGIIQYCRAWKHQDDDVRALNELTNGLKTVLQDVEIFLQQQPNLDLTAVPSVRHSLKACNDQISKALDISDKYATAQASTKGKMKDLIQRLKFPFQRNVLGELRDIMTAFRGNVDVALQLLNIDLTVSETELIRKLHSDSKAGHQMIISEIKSAATQITTSFSHDQNQRLSAQTDSLTTAIGQRIDTSGYSIENKISQSSAAVISQVQVTSTESTMRNMELQRYLEKISSDQEKTLHSIQQIQERVLTGSEPFLSLSGAVTTSRKKKRSRFRSASTDAMHCTCDASKVITKLNFMPYFYSRSWSILKESEASVIHDRRCPMWYQSRKDTKYRFHSRIFGWQVSGSLDLRRLAYASFSGCTILPSLNIRPLVSRDAASFRVLRRYLWGLSNAANLIRDLRIIFQSGHGSPWDVHDGRGLLEVS